MRKITRKGWIRKLDDLCKRICIKRTPRCVICDTMQNLTPGHLFSRVAHSTRWDMQNIWTQCAKHNFSHERDPYPFNKWYIAAFGMESWDELHKKWHTTRPYKTWELEELYKELESWLKSEEPKK